jgi:hypothetical protein
MKGAVRRFLSSTYPALDVKQRQSQPINLKTISKEEFEKRQKSFVYRAYGLEVTKRV